MPAVQNAAWVRNPVDAFILARLEEVGLKPQPEADRFTLIRRLSFDLTGLPPMPEEVDRFVNDPAPDAYQQLVERLLSSKAYGERWAQHWLDLARFSETDGFEHDHVRPNAWRYRDWVIDALNADLPYDEFVRLQLAGDELRPDDPQAAIATGFLLCGPDMPDINLQEERRHVFLNDMTATVGSALLALQVGCAQCHDHKYDPISQLDFYRLRAFFEPADIFHEHPIPTAKQQQQLAEFRSRQETELRRLEAELQKAAADGERDALKRQLGVIRNRKPPETDMGRVMHNPTGPPRASHLMIRGDFRRPGPEVMPAYLRVVNLSESTLPAATEVDNRGRRSALADWLFEPNHPLTARVIVNRVWMHHFGEGLVRTPSDFGATGDLPTHSELLDWLATELPRQGWSLKWLHRLLVTSATFRQASRPLDEDSLANWKQAVKADPDNRLLARMSRRRLEGEAIRDAMLAAGDRLSQRSGGPGVRPPLEPELVKTLLKNQWPVSPDEEDHRRRSIYLFARRNLRYPLFEVFDKPDSNASCPQRNRSTIAPQALTLLNSAFTLSAARDLAELVLQQTGNDTDWQVELCYRRTLGRPPSPQELVQARTFLEQNAMALQTETADSNELRSPNLPLGIDPYVGAALTDFCVVLFNLNEFVYVD